MLVPVGVLLLLFQVLFSGLGWPWCELRSLESIPSFLFCPARGCACTYTSARCPALPAAGTHKVPVQSTLARSTGAGRDLSWIGDQELPQLFREVTKVKSPSQQLQLQLTSAPTRDLEGKSERDDQSEGVRALIRIREFLLSQEQQQQHQRTLRNFERNS